MSYDLRYRLTRIDICVTNKRLSKSLVSSLRSVALKKSKMDDEEAFRLAVARTSPKILSFKYDAININKSSHETKTYISNSSSLRFSAGGISSHRPFIFSAMLITDSATMLARDCSLVLLLFDVYPT